MPACTLLENLLYPARYCEAKLRPIGVPFQIAFAK